MVRLHTVPGMPTAVFPFTTDIPLLDRWGTPLLYGPGSFLVAHTADGASSDRGTRGGRGRLSGARGGLPDLAFNRVGVKERVQRIDFWHHARA